MAYYFDKNVECESKETKTYSIIKNQSYVFITDNNVFSKKGLDFGTRTLLENLPYIKGDVLDFGCGYGPIGIFLKKNYDVNVDMIDINSRSLNLALKNAKENNVSVNIFESNIYENVNKKYDYIISNPPIRVGNEMLYKILFEAKEYLKEKGKLIFVINKNQGAKTVAKNLLKMYSVNIIAKDKGFYVIEAENN